MILAASTVPAVTLWSFRPAFGREPLVHEFAKPGGKNGRVLLYVGAKNCPSCNKYQATTGSRSREEIIGFASQGLFRYVEVVVFMFSNIGDRDEWPKEFHWVIPLLPRTDGTPRWLLLDNKKKTLRRNLWGWNDQKRDRLWDQVILPLTAG
jgi:hypothetical protein